MKSLILLACTLVTAPAFATKSAHREPGESYLKYMSPPKIQSVVPAEETAAEDAAANYGSVTLPDATIWPSTAMMEQNFGRMRDFRFMTTDDHPGFLRRPSWLYPDDGCFARAGAAILDFFKWKVAVPSKIFAFGDLTVATKNSDSGFVNWWYHVAPLVQVGGQKYVLDPAIDPTGPLKLEDWLKKMSADPTQIRVAVCHSGTYTPSDICATDTDGVEKNALTDEPDFLKSEWDRLKELNRSPNDELGDKPPWAAHHAALL